MSPPVILALRVPTLGIHDMVTWRGKSRTWLVTGVPAEHWDSRGGITDPIPAGAVYRLADDVADEEKESALANGGALVTTWEKWEP